MSVQRFSGANNREAMAKVRLALGDGALILANRPGDDGVEILALAEQDVDRLADGSPPAGQDSERLLQEMARMRSLLSPRHRSDADPERTQLWRRLEQAGFSPALSEQLLEAMPASPPDGWLSAQLQARLRVAPAQSLSRTAAVVALVGPTGVGKTTTAAKLAANHVRTHGAADVMLVSADNQRPGAHFQLGFHADRLGVKLLRLADDRRLGDLLPDIRGKGLVIVDTAGLGQRDDRLTAQLRQLVGGPPVTPVLLLGAASHPRTLDDVVVNYRATAEAVGLRLEQAVITKQDEALRTGPVLDVLMRHQLRLHYVCNGQRVPEDLRAAAGGEWVSEALANDDSDDAAPRLPLPAPHRLLRQNRMLGEVLALLRRHSADGAGLESLWRRWTTADGTSGGVDGISVDGTPVGAHPGSTQAAALSWHGGGDQPGMVQALDRAGLPLAGCCREWTAIGMTAALEEVESCWSVGVQMLPRLPDASAWAWLTARDRLWVSRARANHRVWYHGERRSLAECRTLARPAGAVSLPHRGRSVRVLLRRLPVAVVPKGGGVSALLEAWFADLRDRVTGAPLTQRCWLLPAGLDDDIATALVIDQWRNEDLPVLAAHTQAQLPAPLRHQAEPETTRMLSRAMAALACRLESEEAEWALDLRARLLNLNGGRRRRGARALVEALITLYSTVDALREMATD